jgi:hypothetical protein
VIYFAVTAFHSLNAYFTQDDGGNLLNMHKYWERSLLDVLGSAVCVVTGAYRPLGGVYYFVLYKLAGFNPLPFRAVCLALMLANVLLAFALMRRLSGSLLAGLFGAVVMANHPAMLEFLYSSGTIYDILCFLFYFLAVRCYFVWRQEGQMAGATALSWRQLAVILVLTGCALDSKEMAMTLPAALLLLELVYFPPNSWSWRETARFVVHQGRGVLATTALVAPTIAVKVLTRNPLSDDPAYAAHSVRATVEGMRTYQHFLLYNLISRDGLSTLELLAILGRNGSSGDRPALPSDEIRSWFSGGEPGAYLSDFPAGRLRALYPFNGLGSLCRDPAPATVRWPGPRAASSLPHAGEVRSLYGSRGSDHPHACRPAGGVFHLDTE